MKKGLLISPPQWVPTAPHLAAPLLAGVLQKKGFAAEAVDLSVRFYNKILDADHLRDTVKKIKRIAEDPFYGNSETDPCARETAQKRHAAVLEFLKDDVFDVDFFVSQTVNAVDTVRSDDFFEPQRMFDAKKKLSYALRVVSLPYYPARIAFDNYYGNCVYGYSWDALQAQAERSEDNIFYDFLETEALRIVKSGYVWVGISITDLSQLLAAVTLGHLIKLAAPEIRVLFGGNYLTQIRLDIEACPSFFDFCCDAVSFGDGETVFPLLVERILFDSPLDGLPQTAFLKDGLVEVGGEVANGFDIEDKAYPYFGGYDFSLYFAPEPVFPVQLSKGCYWGKCTFCDYFNGEPCFLIKSVPRAVDELEYYVEVCGARAFFIVDEALPPSYCTALANEMICRNLSVGFYAFARLENGFTPDVLTKLHAAGAKLLMWGYEAASPRVMKLLNKGIDIENRLNILRSAADAGIWNNGLFIIGSPTETLDEAYDTLNVIMNNEALFHSVTLANFNLTRNSAMMQDPEKYGIGDVDQSPFLKKLNDTSEGMSVTERLHMRGKFDRILNERRKGRPWTTVYSDFDHLLLYLIHYGRNETDRIRLLDRKTK